MRNGSKRFADPTSLDPSIEQLLGEILGELAEQLHRGIPLDLQPYEQKHPGLADKIRQLTPTLKVMNDLGRPDVTEAKSTAGQPHESPDSDPKPLGDFKVLREIGRGGMGVVYEAEQLSLGRRVALKVLPYAAVVDQTAIKRFKNESRAAAGLDHPHIVSVYGVGEDRGVHYYAMQLIRGQSLAELITQLKAVQVNAIPASPDDSEINEPSASTRRVVGKEDTANALSSRPGPEFFRAVANLGIQAAEALQYAHNQGVLHRDIKPGNLLLDAEANLYVADFGLARLEADAGVTMTGDVIGTLRYMSPEQALAKHGMIDHRSDIYSLGVTLYELLTLRPVFVGTDRQEVLRQIADSEPVAPRLHNHSIPRDLETIVLKAIAMNATERYQSAGALAEDLHRYLEDLPISARRPSTLSRAGKLLRRHRTVAMATTAVTILALAVSTVVIAVKQAETNAALSRSIEETKRAERNLEIARGVVDRLYDNLYADEVAENRIVRAEGEEQSLKEMSLAYEALAEINDESPELRLQNALTWQRIGWIRFHLWQGDRSIAAFSRCLTELDDLALAAGQSPQVDRARAAATCDLALVQKELGNTEQAHVTYVSAISQFDKLLENAVHDDELIAAKSRATLEYADTLAALGRFADAEDIFRQNIPIQQGLVRLAPEDSERTEVLAQYYQSLGCLLYAMHRIPEAAQALEEAKPWRERAVLLGGKPRTQSRMLAMIHESLDFVYWKMGKAEDAIAARQEAFQIRLELLRGWPSAAQLIRELVYTAKVLAARTGQDTPYERTLKALDEAIPTIDDGTSGADYSMDARLEALHQGAILLLYLRRHEEAEKAYRSTYVALEDLRRIHPQTITSSMSPSNLLDMARGLAASLERQGKQDEATAAFQLGTAELDDTLPLMDAASMAADYNHCAWALAFNDSAIYRDTVRALKYANKAVELNPSFPRFLNTLGAVQYVNGQYEEAVKSLERSKELCPVKTDVAICYDDLFLSMCYWQLNQQDRAKEAHRNAWQLYLNEKNFSYIGELKQLFATADEMLGLPKAETSEADMSEPPAIGYPFDFKAALPSAPLVFTRAMSGN